MGWTATRDNLRILSVREVRDSWGHWATVVFTTVHKDRLVPDLRQDITHRVWWFADTTDATDPLAPTRTQLNEIIDAASSLQEHDRLIVHCHGGMNRSPATALAVMVATGTPPAEAVALLVDIRPIAKPNPLVIAHAEALLGVGLMGHLRAAGLVLQGEDHHPPPRSAP